MDKSWRGVKDFVSFSATRVSPRVHGPSFVLGFPSSIGVTRHLPFSLKTFASWHWCPSHGYVDRSLNLDARCRFDSTARTKQPKLRFLFTHEVFMHLFLPTRFFFAYAESWIFNLGGEWHRPSNIWVCWISKKGYLPRSSVEYRIWRPPRCKSGH